MNTVDSHPLCLLLLLRSVENSGNSNIISTLENLLHIWDGVYVVSNMIINCMKVEVCNFEKPRWEELNINTELHIYRLIHSAVKTFINMALIL